MCAAMRTVGNRCEMTIVVRPCASCRKRLKTACSASASSEAVGSSSTRMSASSRMNARASAIFCHWPPDSSVPSWNQRPSGASRPSASAATTSLRAAALDRALDARLVVHVLDAADADVLARP